LKEKTKNTNEASEMIKAELIALLEMNSKRKSALEKLSKAIMKKEQIKNSINQLNITKA